MKIAMKINKIFLLIGLIILVFGLSSIIYHKILELNAYENSSKILDELKININVSEHKKETLKIDNFNYIGIIIIPSLNLELPVMDNYEHLNISPGKYYGSVLTNDLVICAHSYKKHFGNIFLLNEGDVVMFVDVNNIAYIYEVKLIEIVKPEEVEKVVDSEFDLTLYTCTKDSLNRVVVRLKRVN